MEMEYNLDKQYIDVRSPSEFSKGHITGAVNLPILYDSERAEVGYLYKQISTEEAKRKGVEFASEKLISYYERVRELAERHNEKNLVFYCARGGYRSQSVYLFFKGLGLDCMKLEGGYKEYRRQVLDTLTAPVDSFPKFIGINGLTGSGKTKILNELEKLGEPVLDLERAARHKGSNLGKIGIPEKQSAQQFENDLFTELISAKKRGYCFVEMESKKIGSLLVPNNLYSAYHDHTFARVWIKRNMEDRIDFLIRDYAEDESFKEGFTRGMEKIRKYISGELYQDILRNLNQDNYREVAGLLLEQYYDPLYLRSTENFVPDVSLFNEDDAATAKEIIEYKNIILK